MSHSLGENSSTAAPAVAPTRHTGSTCPKDIFACNTRKAIPIANDKSIMAQVPSHDFFPSAGLSFTLCLPNGIPTNAAAASPTPHIRMAVAVSIGLPNTPHPTAVSTANITNRRIRLSLISPGRFSTKRFENHLSFSSKPIQDK